MQQSFQHILSLSIKHAYFKDGHFKSIQFSQAEDTPNLLHDLGMVIKPFTGGAHFLVADPEVLKNTNSDSRPIRLYLSCSDPYYINYTELPEYELSKTVLYFNNLNDSVFLHEGDYVGESQIAYLSFGKITIPEFEDDNNYVFLDAKGREISKDHFRQSTENSNDFMVSDLTEGLIRIIEDGQQVAEVYFVPTSIWKKPLGIMEIYPEKLYQDFKNSGKQDYVVQFINQHTIWKYFLVDPVYQKFKNLSIVSSNPETVFGACEETEINNTKSWLIASEIELPLEEYSEHSFKLVNDNTSPSIIKVLPRASPEQLFYDDNNRESIYSHIYL